MREKEKFMKLPHDVEGNYIYDIHRQVGWLVGVWQAAVRVFWVRQTQQKQVYGHRKFLRDMQKAAAAAIEGTRQDVNRRLRTNIQ